jgi:hypothetical protein
MAAGMRKPSNSLTQQPRPCPSSFQPANNQSKYAQMANTSLAGGGLGLISWILLGGGLTMMFFVVLSGVKDVSPLNKIYFMQADLSSVPDARPLTQWTYFYICGEKNTNCGDPVPALPFGYAWVANTQNVPTQLVGKHGKGTTSAYYYYMWRFGWVFLLVALVFGSIAVISGLLSFTRIGSGISGLVVFAASGFQTLGAVLMTFVLFQ